MGNKKQKQQLVITSGDEIIDSMSLEEINLLLNAAQTSYAEEIYLEIEDRELSNLLAE